MYNLLVTLCTLKQATSATVHFTVCTIQLKLAECSLKIHLLLHR